MLEFTKYTITYSLPDKLSHHVKADIYTEEDFLSFSSNWAGNEKVNIISVKKEMSNIKRKCICCLTPEGIANGNFCCMCGNGM